MSPERGSTFSIDRHVGGAAPRQYLTLMRECHNVRSGPVADIEHLAINVTCEVPPSHLPNTGLHTDPRRFLLTAMEPNVSTLERAFQLAATGRYVTVSEIKLVLTREGYRHELVDGPELSKQLVAAITKARAERAPKPRRK